MNLYIDPNWTFREVFSNIRALKQIYKDTLRSFSYFDMKKVVDFKYSTRDKFYSLNIEEWQADRLWEYMNDFCPFECLIDIAIKIRNRQK